MWNKVDFDISLHLYQNSCFFIFSIRPPRSDHDSDSYYNNINFTCSWTWYKKKSMYSFVFGFFYSTLSFEVYLHFCSTVCSLFFFFIWGWWILQVNLFNLLLTNMWFIILQYYEYRDCEHSCKRLCGCTQLFLFNVYWIR